MSSKALDEAKAGTERDAVTATLVIAHPDDECMFFSPTLSRLSANSLGTLNTGGSSSSRGGGRVKWTVLCLSNGNACGLGKVREKELFESCATFKIRPECVQFVDDPRLQDGMDIEWDASVVADFIERHLDRHGSAHVISFDSLGISRHTNHIACFRGLQILKEKKEKKKVALGFWVQETATGGLFQYFGILTVLWQSLLSSCVGGKETKAKTKVLCMQTYSLSTALRAMKMHRSQLVWYRYLHLIFSRYVYINRLRKV
jgi:N-acetylglucosaminylphosphatidylinositol deacetylase